MRRSGRSGPGSGRSRFDGRGCATVATPSTPIRSAFTSEVLPPYLRRTRNIEELLPWLYLKGISTGQFSAALTALLGADAPGLSAATVRRLTETWQAEHLGWYERDLSVRRGACPRAAFGRPGGLSLGGRGLLHPAARSRPAVHPRPHRRRRKWPQGAPGP